MRVTAALLLFAGSAAAGPIWIDQSEYDALHLVVQGSEIGPDATAARRFRVRWNEITGFEPTVSDSARPGAVNVWIGEAARAVFPGFFVDAPSEDGFIIRALRDETGAHLVLAGGGSRGTLYAEWEFLERYMGAKSFGAGGFVWPDPPPASIPPIDFRWEPPFAYRDTNFSTYVGAPWLASLNRLNGQWTALPDALGGHLGFVGGLAGYGHTFHRFVNPDEYFDTHPEYFAEIDGARVKWSQLCLTNPDVLAITIARAREFLRTAAPHERILSISQMDYPGFASWCTCVACRAVDLEEGGHSGTVIRFVNAVAEALGAEFPQTLFETFAYMHTRTPPRYTRPRENVLVRVCAIEADYGRPLSDRASPANRAFVRDLKEWRRIARHVYAWDYTQNWWAFQAPHPNLHVLQPNIAFYRRIGVDGLFEQASPYASNSDFEPLKAYLVGRGLRDPGFDGQQAYKEFLAYYYGSAAPFIDEYQVLLRDRLRDFGGPLWFYNDLNWLDAETVERAQEIFARARNAAPDPPYADRVQQAYVAVQFAALVCPPRVYQEPDAYVFTRPPSQALSEYLAMLESRGVQFLNDYPLASLTSRMRGITPPRFKRAPIERLSGAGFDAWIVAERSGAVVRWRERDTGRDWLRSFDSIWVSTSRLQDWADTSPHPTARPYPVDQPYDVVSRADDTIELETTLDNGINIRRRMTALANGLEMTATLENRAAEPVKPKFGVGMEWSTRGMQRPALWAESDDKWTRRQWTRDTETGLDTWRADVGTRRWAVRFPAAARTILIEPDSGEIGRQSVSRASRGDSATTLIEMDARAMEPGETRDMTFRVRIIDEPPPRLAPLR